MFSLSLGFTKYEVEKNGNKKQNKTQNRSMKPAECQFSLPAPLDILFLACKT